MKILVVDDSNSIREQLSRLLTKAFPDARIMEASSGLEAISQVKEVLPDLIIMDIQMPQMTGYETLRILQAHEKTREVPVIFLTGTFQEEKDMVEGLTLGAVDYVMKPINEAVFLARVKVMLRLKTTQDQIRNQSFHDPLTGCYNRRYMLQRLKEELHRANRNQTPLSGIMMDIDHFKKINDTYGHAAGDQVLVKLSAVLRLAMRTYDILARWGGEEFFILLPNTHPSSAQIMAERMRVTVENLKVEVEDHIIQPAASFGVSGFDGKEVPLEPQVLINQADQALYEAKRRGRNQVVCYKEAQDDH